MAVENIATESVLRLQLQTGVDTNGNPVFRTKSLYNIKPDATDQDLFDVAQGLAGLQQYVLENVLRVDNARIEEAV